MSSLEIFLLLSIAYIDFAGKRENAATAASSQAPNCGCVWLIYSADLCKGQAEKSITL
jgi:hypothetical protein